MKNIILLFVFISSLAFSQEYDYQQLCINCAQAQGFYCGDDPSNWTQYAPNGCVQNSWINDGWEDCVDAADEMLKDLLYPQSVYHHHQIVTQSL